MAEEKLEIKLNVVNGSGERQQERALKLGNDMKVDEHALALSERIIRGNRRQHSAHTLGRGQVRGGGKKPWRQKGTGRARQGSIRAVQWKGGGVAFGPGNASFDRELNRKQKKRALNGALADKSRNGRILFVSERFPAEPRTKHAQQFLVKSGISGKILLLLGSEEKDTRLAFRNLPKVRLVGTEKMNALDVLTADYLIVSLGGQEHLTGLLEGRK